MRSADLHPRCVAVARALVGCEAGRSDARRRRRSLDRCGRSALFLRPDANWMLDRRTVASCHLASAARAGGDRAFRPGRRRVAPLPPARSTGMTRKCNFPRFRENNIVRPALAQIHGRARSTMMNRRFRNFSFVSLLAIAALAAVAAVSAKAADNASQSAGTQQMAVFAGGCFWGVDAVFKHVKGVSRVVSGYSGGSASTAQYDTVSTGATGHAESVEVTYDPAQVTYGELLRVFFTVAHDPTQLDRQGPDEGTQYRSVVFYASDAQRRAALGYIDTLRRDHLFSQAIVTQVVPLVLFYPAEEYHQSYLARHPDQPYIVYNDLPKLARLKERLPELYRP